MNLNLVASLMKKEAAPAQNNKPHGGAGEREHYGQFPR